MLESTIEKTGMKKCIFSIIVLFACLNLNAQQLNLGVKLQKTHSLYWENGISLQYSLASFKPNQFYVGFDIFSSRIGTAFKSNAIKQESYIGSAVWYIRKNKSFRILTKLNIGFFYADLETEIFDELPNTAILLSPEVGLSYSIKKIPVIINLSSGYNIGLKGGGESPGTLQPLFYSLTLFYRLKE